MATLVAWVPESTWPLPLAELIGRPNGRKTARNGAKMATFGRNMLRRRKWCNSFILKVLSP